MLIERQQRDARVRFQHPIRVVTLEGQPRVIRTLTSNVSRDGLFLRMPEPLPPGMKVALSLEAGGRALALAQAEVRWNGPDANEITERFPGCGVRFTEFMHPRAEELVRYLVNNLDTGKPLALAPPEKRWMKWLPIAGGGALLACAAMAAVIFWTPDEVEPIEPDTPKVQLVAAAPVVHVAAPADEKVTTPAQAVEAATDPVTDKIAAEANPVSDKIAVAKVEATPDPVSEKSTVANVDTTPAPVTDKVGIAKGEARPDPVSVKIKEAPPAPTPATVTAAAMVLKVEPPKSLPVEKKRKPERQGDVKLTAGASPQLHWEVTGTELRLAPQLPDGVQLSRAFVLTGPARAVFDLTGGPAARSLTVPAAPPYATGVRIGKQAAGTRIVVDLDNAPKRSKQDGDALVLGF